MERQTNRGGAKSGRALSFDENRDERTCTCIFVSRGLISRMHLLRISFEGSFADVLIIRSKWSVSFPPFSQDAVAAHRLRKLAQNARARHGVRWPGIKTQSRLSLGRGRARAGVKDKWQSPGSQKESGIRKEQAWTNYTACTNCKRGISLRHSSEENRTRGKRRKWRKKLRRLMVLIAQPRNFAVELDQSRL